ncbi:MAG TPA: GSU2403 family nucleotidyltransferase fold protein [Myxococcaceae bacterium]|nr:GSU2403 family nucleotidyltransferase fold protein [Myxococcaceae bacterium]
MAALTDREAFARLVIAVEPYLDALVFVGGWAHRLYAFHELADPIDFEPLATDDADLAAPARLQVRKETLAARLKSAGFTEEFRGEDTPPISEYHLGEEEAGLYVEFLAPLAGGSMSRKGKPRDTALVGGVTAQTLRYVDLLLEAPWSVRIHQRLGFPVGKEGFQIRIPNPASFIAQKMLVLDRRAPSKRPKDLLYMHDTLVLFSQEQAALRASWQLVRAAHVARTLKEQVERRFGRVDDLVREACRIAEETGRPSPPTPERFAELCLAGTRAIFTAD